MAEQQGDSSKRPAPSQPPPAFRPGSQGPPPPQAPGSQPPPGPQPPPPGQGITPGQPAPQGVQQGQAPSGPPPPQPPGQAAPMPPAPPQGQPPVPQPVANGAPAQPPAPQLQTPQHPGLSPGAPMQHQHQFNQPHFAPSDPQQQAGAGFSLQRLNKWGERVKELASDVADRAGLVERAPQARQPAVAPPNPVHNFGPQPSPGAPQTGMPPPQPPSGQSAPQPTAMQPFEQAPQQQQQQQQQHPAPPPPSAANVYSQQQQAQGGHVHSPGAGAFDLGQQLIENFQSVTVSQGAPGQGAGMDPAEFPRPDYSEEGVPFHGDHNCDPRYMRATSWVLPATQSLKQSVGLPMGAVIRPLAPVDDVPVVSYGSHGIPRCKKCRSYINPWFKWIEGGRRFVCNLCGHAQDIEPAHWASVNAYGQREDHHRRPELHSGTVEFHAGEEYMVRAPMPPTYFFAIDVSRSAVESGAVRDAVETIRACLDDLPGGNRTQVGFLTYDNTLHFYSMRPGGSHPQMMVVPDMEDSAQPVPDDLLVNLAECRGMVEAVLDVIVEAFNGTHVMDSAFGAALRAANSAMAHVGGKLVMFQSTLPSIGPGMLKRRDDPKLYNTDREHFLRTPADSFYKKLAAECAKVQVAVELFALGIGGNHLDLASLAAVPKYTGGQLYYYRAFGTFPTDGERLGKDVARCLTRETAWEAVVRVRCGTGLKVKSFDGNFFVRSTDLLAMPSYSGDNAFAIELAHEEAGQTGISETFLQCALLYTSSSGERRIRVHNLRLPVSNSMQDIFHSVDTPALTSLIARHAASRSLSAKLEDSRSFTVKRVADVLRSFRHHTSQQARSLTKLVFPESMRLLPLYAMCLLKSAALRGAQGDVPADERSASNTEMMAMPPEELLTYLYPKLFPVHLLPAEAGTLSDEGETILPPPMPLSGQHIDQRGVYLGDDGREMVMWLGSAAPAELLEGLFGVEGIPPDATFQLELRPGDTDISLRVWRIVEALRWRHTRYKPLTVVAQGQQGESLLFPFLREDHGGANSVGSYADFLVMLHNHVQSSSSK